MQVRRLALSWMSLAYFAGSGLALAESAPPLEDRFVLQLGGFLVSTDTRVRVDGSAGLPGTEFNWEADTGTGDVDRFRVDTLWRITPRHRLRAMYFDTNRSAERGFEEDIVFQGETFPVGALVKSRYEFSILEIAYEFAFLRRDNYELAASIGAHNVDMGLRLQAAVTVDGEPLGRGELNESASTKGPLPVLGLRGIWRIADKWYLDGHAQFFGLEFDEYDGQLVDAQASVIWQAFRNVGLGLGYNYFDTQVDVDGRLLDGRIEWSYGGLMLFARASF